MSGKFISTAKCSSLMAKAVHAFEAERAKRIVKGIISAAGAKLLIAGVTLFSLPLAVRYLGVERYGIWVTVTTITSWVAMLDLGISNTLTNSISTAFAKDDSSMAARHTSTALAITLAVVGLVGIVSVITLTKINWMDLFNISNHVRVEEVRETVAVAFALVLLSPTCTLGSKILSGYQETHIYNIITAASAVGSLIGLAAGVALHVSMPILFLCTSGAVTASGLGTLTWVLFVHKPWLRPRLSYVALPLVKDLLGSGSSLFLIQIAAIVIFSTDNLVISHYLGAAEVTPYSVTMRLVAYAQLLPMFLFPALWPAYAEAHARRDFRWIRRTFRLAMAGSTLTTAALLTFFIVFGQALIGWWAGSSAVPPQRLIVAMAFWTLISALAGVQSCLLSAVGRTRVQGITSVVSAILNIGISIYLVQKIGSLGVVLGTIISVILVVIIPQLSELRRYFRETSGAGENVA